MQKLIATSAGFLLAVLWFDLMFDVQALEALRTGAQVSDEALGSISHYYRRVTTEAAPMNLLVGAVMLIGVAAALINLFRRRAHLWVRILTLALLAAPVAFAQLWIFPAAQELGQQQLPMPAASEAAAGILAAHLVCFAAIALVILLQFVPERREA